MYYVEKVCFPSDWSSCAKILMADVGGGDISARKSILIVLWQSYKLLKQISYNVPTS